MSNITEYPVFEPDQVLKSDHLNNMFNYLDEQNRLTRRNLIGIGIVCGLDSYYSSSTINITKGLGITSLGYLIQFDGSNYTYARNYVLPDDTQVDEHSFYSGFKLWKLFSPTTDNPLVAGDEVLSNSTFLQDKVVMLFLEWRNVDLKNCTTIDCDDKGQKAQFTIQPLLIAQKDLATFKYTGFQSAKGNLPDIVLKRYNVPFKQLKSPTDVLNSFYNITDATTLKSIADAYNNVYNTFKPILNGEGSNPFDNLFKILTTIASTIKTSKAIFTEYFYDYIDDLVKAYLEFREKADSLLVECCPDGNLFPFHLALSEALVDSRTNVSAYRNYFIHSPVFGTQKTLAAEVQMLFLRMKLLLGHFSLPDVKTIPGSAVKITPSELGKSYLSDRAIPYYYNTATLLNYWNFERSSKGKSSKNLSYHANTYSTDDKVVNPLKYELERYNFFRVEGHIGKQIDNALATIVQQKQSFSLPFDVIALNVAAGNVRGANMGKCHFADLESLFNVMLAELLCKIHEPVCFLSGLPYVNLDQFTAGLAIAGGTAAVPPTGTTLTDLNAATGFRSLSDLQNLVSSATKRVVLTTNINTLTRLNQNFIDQEKLVAAYRKGTFLQHFCAPGTAAAGKPKTVGQVYLETIKTNATAFPKPAAIDTSGTINFNVLLSNIYHHIFYFIDTAEEMFAVSLTKYLNNLDYAAFQYKYKLLVQEAEDFTKLVMLILVYYENLNKDTTETKLQDFVEDAVIDLLIDEMEMITHLCMDEKINQLLDEYQKRLQQLNLDRMFSYYTTQHSGIDHKAGVPKGGTFILVYEDKVVTSTVGKRTAVLSVQPPIADAIISTAQPIEGAALATAQNIKLAADATTVGGAPKTASSNFSDATKIFELNKSKLTEEEFASALDLIDKIRPIDTSRVDTFRIGEKIVFADFYLPYMCCSDCSPISYIIPASVDTPPDPTTIKLSRNIICSNDTDPLTITVNPKGGVLSLTKVTQLNETTYQVAVVDLPLGETAITYTENSQTASDKISVFSVPDAAFTNDLIPSKPGAVQFHYNSTDANLQHEWIFGDPNSGALNSSNLAEPVHEFTVPEVSSDYNVSHAVSTKDGCKTTVTQIVTIKNIPPATIKLNKNTFCNNSIEALSIDVSPSGGTLSLTAAQKISDTNFQVALKDLPIGDTQITYSVNGQSASDKVTIFAAPDASFKNTALPSNPGSVQFTSKFTDSSAKHVWSFGDPKNSSSNDANPVQNYPFTDKSVDYQVQHTVTSKDGCIDSVIKNVTVINIQPASIILDKNSFCSNDNGAVTITVNPIGGLLSIPTAKKVNETTFQVAIKDLSVGDTAITYTVNSQVASTKVTVLQVPDAEFSFASVPSNFQFSIQFKSALTDSSAQHTWDFGDPTSANNTSTDANPVHNYQFTEPSKSFSVVHTVTSKNGCVSIISHPVPLTNAPAIINETRALCFTTQLSIEDPTIVKTAVLLNADSLSETFKKYGITVDGKLQLTFASPLPETIGFVLNYTLDNGSTVVTKNVDVTVIAVNTTFNLQQDAASKGALLTALATNTKVCHWSVVINTQPSIDADGPKLIITADKLANMETMLVTLTVSQVVKGVECRGGKRTPITRPQFLKIMQTTGGSNI